MQCLDQGRKVVPAPPPHPSLSISGDSGEWTCPEKINPDRQDAEQEHRAVSVPAVNLFEPLKDFEDRLPHKPYCGRYKSNRFIMQKEQAKAMPYIQANFPVINYLPFDCDFTGAANRAHDMGLPEPTLTVITPGSGYAHLMYQLGQPIPRKHSKATRGLMNRVIYGYKEMLCADKCITQPRQLVKNPLSPEWDVVVGHMAFTLYELAESIPNDLTEHRRCEPALEPVKVKRFEETLDPNSRNCSLFQNARLYAYSTVNEHGGYDSLYDAVLRYIEHLNDDEVPEHFPVKILKTGELRSIAKSISKWTWRYRSRFESVSPGAMQFPPMNALSSEEYKAEVARRRSLSAQRTNGIRTESTKRKIIEAVYLCWKHEKDVNVANISTLARVSKRTIYKYRELIEELEGKRGQNQ